MTYHDPRKFFSLAGKDEKTGEIILKVVNAYNKPYSTKIDVKGTSTIESDGETIVLSTESPDSENSIDEPMKYVPETEKYSGFSSSFTYIFKPYSITMLRMKVK
jgi:alpha-L-arabinofuranosidase